MTDVTHNTHMTIPEAIAALTERLAQYQRNGGSFYQGGVRAKEVDEGILAMLKTMTPHDTAALIVRLRGPYPKGDEWGDFVDLMNQAADALTAPPTAGAGLREALERIAENVRLWPDTLDAATALYGIGEFASNALAPPDDPRAKKISDAEKYLAARIAPSPEGAEPVAWRCFHCDEVLTDKDAALLHFGPRDLSDPACQISIAHVREIEGQLDRYHAEDSDADRRYYAMQADHTRALMREEEKGYERGLRDARLEAADESIEAALFEAVEELRQSGEGIVTAASARHYFAKHGLAIASQSPAQGETK